MKPRNWVGQTLGGRYTLEAVLGSGGMSSVYKGTDPNLKRVVAVKMIHPHLSENPDFVFRFKEEAAAVAQLRHPNIVQVFDFDNDADTYYMVLEFVPGETLQTRLKRFNAADRRLPVSDAVEFAAQICDAADYAHQRGLIHRDIKPANVMLDVHGRAILMDFGIAKIVGGQTHTATGATIGTASYMSPEQIRSDRVDERSDIYSIGVTLFEMVSGRPPYEADSAMTLLMMHLQDPVPDLRQIRPNTSNDLVRIIEQALEKDRAERFQTATEMATALRKMLDRVQDASPDVTVVESSHLEKKPLAETPLAGAMPVAATPGEGPRQALAMATASRASEPSIAALPADPQAQPVAQRSEPQVGQFGGAVPSAKAAPAGLKMSPMWIAGGAVGLIALLIFAFVIGTAVSGGGDSPSDPIQDTTVPAAAQAEDVTNTATAPSQGATGTAEPAAAQAQNPTGTAVAMAASQTPEPTASLTPTIFEEPPTATPVPTNTHTPTAEPTAIQVPPTATDAPTPTSAPTALPTATQSPGPSAQIQQITVQGNDYVVAYQTIGFTESVEQWHTHFFFNTVPPDQAGVPGTGPWILYYGPSPFTEYKVSDRPAGATQMCVRVANADHTLYNVGPAYLNTGNCVDLP